MTYHINPVCVNSSYKIIVPRAIMEVILVHDAESRSNVFHEKLDEETLAHDISYSLGELGDGLIKLSVADRNNTWETWNDIRGTIEGHIKFLMKDREI